MIVLAYIAAVVCAWCALACVIVAAAAGVALWEQRRARKQKQRSAERLERRVIEDALIALETYANTAGQRRSA